MQISCQETIEQLGFPKATINPITKFSQVSTEMFGACTMANASDIAFDIRNQVMNPVQELYRIHPRANCERLVTALGRIENAI